MWPWSMWEWSISWTRLLHCQLSRLPTATARRWRCRTCGLGRRYILAHEGDVANRPLHLRLGEGGPRHPDDGVVVDLALEARKRESEGLTLACQVAHEVVRPLKSPRGVAAALGGLQLEGEGGPRGPLGGELKAAIAGSDGLLAVERLVKVRAIRSLGNEDNLSARGGNGRHAPIICEGLSVCFPEDEQRLTQPTSIQRVQVVDTACPFGEVVNHELGRARSVDPGGRQETGQANHEAAIEHHGGQLLAVLTYQHSTGVPGVASGIPAGKGIYVPVFHRRPTSSCPAVQRSAGCIY